MPRYIITETVAGQSPKNFHSLEAKNFEEAKKEFSEWIRSWIDSKNDNITYIDEEFKKQLEEDAKDEYVNQHGNDVGFDFKKVFKWEGPGFYNANSDPESAELLDSEIIVSYTDDNKFYEVIDKTEEKEEAEAEQEKIKNMFENNSSIDHYDIPDSILKKFDSRNQKSLSLIRLWEKKADKGMPIVGDRGIDADEFNKFENTIEEDLALCGEVEEYNVYEANRSYYLVADFGKDYNFYVEFQIL